jgi:hypothetical protein
MQPSTRLARHRPRKKLPPDLHQQALPRKPPVLPGAFFVSMQGFSLALPARKRRRHAHPRERLESGMCENKPATVGAEPVSR